MSSARLPAVAGDEARRGSRSSVGDPAPPPPAYSLDGAAPAAESAPAGAAAAADGGGADKQSGGKEEKEKKKKEKKKKKKEKEKGVMVTDVLEEDEDAAAGAEEEKQAEDAGKGADGASSASSSSESGSSSSSESGSSSSESGSSSSSSSSESSSSSSESEEDIDKEAIRRLKKNKKTAELAAALKLKEEEKRGRHPILNYTKERQPKPQLSEAEKDRERQKRAQRMALPLSEQLLAVVEENDVATAKMLLDSAENSANTLLYDRGGSDDEGDDDDPDAAARRKCDIAYTDDVLGENSIIRAARLGYFSMLKVLIASYLRPGPHDTPSQVEDKRSKLATLMNETDFLGYTALMHAAANGHFLVAVLLVEYGAQFYAADPEGWTPVMFAAQNGHWHIVEFLVGKEAVGGVRPQNDPVAMSRRNSMRLNIEGSEPIIGLRPGGVAPRADPATINRNGETALMKAAQNGHLPVVRFLCNNPDIDLNMANKDGNTALMLASMFGQMHICRYMLSKTRRRGQAAIRSNLKNKAGETASNITPTEFAVVNYSPDMYTLPEHERQKHSDARREWAETDPETVARRKRVPVVRHSNLVEYWNSPEEAAMTAQISRAKSTRFQQGLIFPPKQLPADRAAAKRILRGLTRQCFRVFEEEAKTELDKQRRSSSRLDDPNAPGGLERRMSSRMNISEDLSWEHEKRWWKILEKRGPAWQLIDDEKSLDNVERVFKARTLWLAGDDSLVHAQFEQALQLYTEARHFAPFHPRLKQAAEAAEFHLSIQEQEETDQKARDELHAQAQALAYATKGDALMEKRDYQEALANYRAAFIKHGIRRYEEKAKDAEQKLRRFKQERQRAEFEKRKGKAAAAAAAAAAAMGGSSATQASDARKQARSGYCAVSVSKP